MRTEDVVEIRQNVALGPYTTLGVGGPARWFATVTTERQVAEAVQTAESLGWALFVLGGGSNLLIRDAGFDGLVIHVALCGIDVEAPTAAGMIRVTVAAGENWDALVQFTVKRNLQGMECLAGIPGTVGGTPVQNVGAYGQDISQTFVSARCFDRQTHSFVELRRDDLGFGYRTSLLNGRERGRYILTSVTFELRNGGRPNVSYADLKRAFPAEAEPSLQQVADAVRTIRRAKGMVVDAGDPDSRSAGSFFRNPVVPLALLEAVVLATGVPADKVPHWLVDAGRVKLAAAWLLEQAGFPRGYTLGAAGISSKHTLALINRGSATERDIAALRTKIVTGVREKFGIVLEQEPVDVGWSGVETEIAL